MELPFSQLLYIYSDYFATLFGRLLLKIVQTLIIPNLRLLLLLDLLYQMSLFGTRIPLTVLRLLLLLCLLLIEELRVLEQLLHWDPVQVRVLLKEVLHLQDFIYVGLIPVQTVLRAHDVVHEGSALVARSA